MRALVHRIARAAGLEVHRYRVGTEFSRTRDELMRKHDVRAAIDVGASDGAYAKELRAHGFAGRIVSFEPLPESYALLQANAAADPRWRAVPVALGAAESTGTLHISGRSTSSSLLEMNPLHLQVAPESGTVGEATVQIARLDDLYAELDLIGEALLLKLDVQGYEAEVLDGARETLSHVGVLEVELSFAPLYEGQPLFAELLAQLSESGFVLVLLERVLSDPKTAELLQVNALLRRVRA